MSNFNATHKTVDGVFEIMLPKSLTLKRNSNPQRFWSSSDITGDVIDVYNTRTYAYSQKSLYLHPKTNRAFFKCPSQHNVKSRYFIDELIEIEKDSKDTSLELASISKLLEQNTGNAEAISRLQLIKQALDTGELSDGYHSFNDLYFQRLILTAALVRLCKDLCWKSWRHSDGELCFGGGWFIVGFDTPAGQYTYHYEEKYWDLFQCAELEQGKTFDGHTSKDVERLLTLAPRETI